MRSARVVITALLLALSSAAAGAAPPSEEVAFIRGGQLVVLDLATGSERVVLNRAGRGPVAWSGDGRLVSSGSRIAGRPTLPSEIVWAPFGERAAYVTPRAGVVVWTPRSSRRIVRDGWGATGVAWSASGRLAIGRSVCLAPCGLPTHRELWVWNGHALHRALAIPDDAGTPLPVTWTSDGRVVWRLRPDSGSLAADGVALYVGRTRMGTTLMYGDFVIRCGRHLAWVEGEGRYATEDKRILLDGRDISRDTARSWVSPSCSADGGTLVASAGRNWQEDRFGHERRAIWQLLPTRKRLTRPPDGWTDETPHVLSDGSILFVRTRLSSRKANDEWRTAVRGDLMLLARGGVTRIATTRFSGVETTVLEGNYYGHYSWPSLIAVWP